MQLRQLALAGVSCNTGNSFMKLIANRVADDELHDELSCTDPFLAVAQGKFCGELVLDARFAVNTNDTSTYQFCVSDMIDEFLDSNTIPVTGKFDKHGARLAVMLIADLEAMIERLRERMPAKRKGQ